MAQRRTRRGKHKPAAPARRTRSRGADAAPPAPRANVQAGPGAGLTGDDVEVHRHGFIVYVPADGAPATAMILGGEEQSAFCTCEQAGQGRGPCPHVARLHGLRRELAQHLGVTDVVSGFHDSRWYRLLAPLAEDHELPLHTVTVRDEVEDGAPVVRVYEPGGGVIATYLAGGPAAERFRSRLVLHPRGGRGPSRALLLQWLMERTATAHEQGMRALGHRTHGQVIEESFWHRLAYHAYREHGREHGQEVGFAPEIDRESGAVRVSVHGSDRAPLFRVTIPQRAARAFLRAMSALLPAGQALPVHGGPLRPRVRMVARPGGGLRIEPVVRVPGADGEERILMIDERFRYGDLAYLPALDRLVALEEPGPVAGALHLSRATDVDGAHASQVLGKVASALGTDGPDEILGLRVLTSFDHVAVDSEALGRDWCWLSMRYGAGAASVTLDEILRARGRGQRFVETEDGWVDTEAPAFAPLAALLAQHQIADLDGLVDIVGDALTGAAAGPVTGARARLRVTRLALLRLLAAGGGLTVSCRGAQAQALERLLAVVPARPLAPLQGLRSTLRDYQVRGVEWLLYLHDNGFGGLLCDDMGLGKTHQVASFLLALREQRQVQGPFLVVCPTTVLSHWQRIIDAHVPGLRAAVFHGGGRDLAATVARADLVLTSYGILRNDIDELARVELAAAVFDEAQLLKNPHTLAYQAAARLATGMRLGLSGTPIENGIEDLAALLDLAVPGYVGSMEAFRARFVVPIEERGDAQARRDLERLIAPFILRRTKHAVLDQLPAKIEDVRTCALSEEQIKLYRDAIDTRGRELIAALRNEHQPVPYIHIFALLTLLKQICCHPALVADDVEHHESHASAKWELAKELLRESLESGHKVVVYSQFLGMLRIFERHLGSLGIGHVKLTGQTRNRGEVIARFQEDPSCRVFLASLTAGGVGIDLVAASVVMHYDRWWNAAREDQATDRVHRIGQTRGVHVLKLVTEGTLEEKIAAIIARKRQLMESVVHEDDQGSLAVLDRQELAALMSLDLGPATAQRGDDLGPATAQRGDDPTGE